jgi:hypothetical protein
MARLHDMRSFYREFLPLRLLVLPAGEHAVDLLGHPGHDRHAGRYAGAMARRSTTKALVKAENMLRQEADKVIGEHQLERQWERRREALISGVEIKQKDAFGQQSGSAER